MRIRALATISVAAALVLAGCGSPAVEDQVESMPAVTSAPPTTEPPATPRPADAEAVPTPTVTPGPIRLAVRRTTVKGQETDIVTVNGWTAYRFEVDENKPPTVNCSFDCLVTWPPALTDGSALEVSGIDRRLVGTVGRKDGDGYVQVTLDGWPLYRFAEDKVPTDAKGEGVGGNWSVVKPDGKPVVKKSEGLLGG